MQIYSQPATGQNQTRSQADVPVPTTYEIAEQGANYDIWQREEYEKAPDGSLVQRTHRYSQIASGLNFWTNGQYEASKEEIDILPDGTAEAIHGQHQIFFPSDIADGTIDVIMPSGQHLKSSPLGLSCWDGTNVVMIAVLTNSVGQLVNSNQIVYPNAFFGVKADLRLTYRLSGIEQDVILHEQIPTPQSLGLCPDTTKLQMLTEFFDPPQPAITSSSTGSQEAADENLDFGTMKMVPGRAFMTDQTGDSGRAVHVAKQWLTMSGRKILVEQVPITDLANDLAQLPPASTQATLPAPLHVVSTKRILPDRRLAQRPDRYPVQIARNTLLDPGLVLDYNTVNSGLTNYTFQSDTTYYISGPVYLFGTNTFEGNTVIKYASGGQINASSGCWLNWQGSIYQPVIFTAKDDNGVGQAISGSTGNPSGYYAQCALNLYGMTNPINSFRILYAKQGIVAANGGNSFYDGQLYDCQNGIEGEGEAINVRNVLFANVLTNFNGASGATVDAQNATFSGSSYLISGFSTNAWTFENCILANVSQLTNGMPFTTFSGTNNGFYNSQEFGVNPATNTFYPFKAVGGANYYLTNGCSFYGYGTPNIDPFLSTDLAVKTTWAPIIYTNVVFTNATTFSLQALRDTNALPALGYHYDPIDWAFGGCEAGSNFIFTAGTSVGWFRTSSGWEHAGYGIYIANQQTNTFQGTATDPCYWVRLNCAQENDKTAGYGPGGLDGEDGGSIAQSPAVQANFLKSYMPANDNGCFFRDDYGYLVVRAQNCEFGSAGLGGYVMSLYLTNCLFCRGNVSQDSGSSGNAVAVVNCTFHGAAIYLTPDIPMSVVVENCALDNTPVQTSGYGDDASYDTYDYNAYTNSSNPFPIGGAHDVRVSGTFNWQSSWFGDFYLPSDSSLIDAGSTNADYLGLYEFTTQTNQTLEATSQVDIGYHYVATDAFGNPLETLTNSEPDYISDANGDGLPDWWELYWFGNLNESAGDLDWLGHTLLWDYQNGFDPDVVGFNLSVANNYVNVTNPPIVLNIFGGIPYYIAVSVDDTNYVQDANWQIYTSSNFNVNLGSVEGWHSVWIGLKGYATNATVNWQWRHLKLDLTPPQIVITNPIVSTVDEPRIQLQGYSPEQLSQISYDLTNANGLETNQQVLIVDQDYSTNLWDFTTNVFEGFDIPLSIGLNTITIHAMDMAGNVTITNVSYTLDYSAKTNPPIIQVNWPLNGQMICGTSFPCQGWVTDPTVSVNAQLVDTNNDTNAFVATVGRDGHFWLQNLPLNGGTNLLTLTVTDVVSNVFTTNLTIIAGNSGLNIDSVSAGQTNVTGEINSNGYTIWVNGTQAMNNGDGTWSAPINPISGTGGVVEAMAIPNTDNGGNGSGGRDIAGNPTSVQGQGMQSPITAPSGVYVVSCSEQGSDHFQENAHDDDTYNWEDGLGGSAMLHYWDGFDSGTWPEGINWPSSTWPEPIPLANLWAIIQNEWPQTNQFPRSDFEYASIAVSAQDPGTGSSFTETVQMVLKFATGGPLGSTVQQLYQFSASVMVNSNPVPENPDYEPWSTQPETTNITDQRVSVGDLGALNANGYVYAMLSDNTRVVVTPSIKGQNDYTFVPPDPSPSVVTLYSLDVVSNSATQINVTNWACIKTPTNNYVYLQANLSTSDTNAAPYIQWSGGEPVPGSPFQRRVTTTNSAKTVVTATLSTNTFSQVIWVIWATINFQTNGTTPPPLSFTNAAGNPVYPDNQLGVGFYYAGASGLEPASLVGTNNYAAGKICGIATVSPAGVHTVISNGWDWVQMRMSHDFQDGVTNATYYDSTWQPDGPSYTGFNKTVVLDASDKLYTIDSPNVDGAPPNDSYETYNNFYDYITWGGQVCCDTNNFWHWQGRWKVDQTPQITFTDLGIGTISLPTTPYYSAP